MIVLPLLVRMLASPTTPTYALQDGALRIAPALNVMVTEALSLDEDTAYNAPRRASTVMWSPMRQASA